MERVKKQKKYKKYKKYIDSECREDVIKQRKKSGLDEGSDRIVQWVHDYLQCCKSKRENEIGTRMWNSKKKIKCMVPESLSYAIDIVLLTNEARGLKKMIQTL